MTLCIANPFYVCVLRECMKSAINLLLFYFYNDSNNNNDINYNNNDRE